MIFVAGKNFTRKFEKKSLVFSTDPKIADIHIDHPALKNAEILVTKDGEFLTFENRSHDPFISIEGLPFFKKKCSLRATLQIGRDEIKLDLEKEPPLPLSSPSLSLDLDELLMEVEHLALGKVNSEVKSQDIKEESNAINPEKGKEKKTLPETSSNNGHQRSEKEEEEKERWDEITPIDKDEEPLEKPSSLGQFGLIAFVLFCTLLLTLVIFGGVYFSILEKNRQEEVKTAQKLADISMALKWASFNRRIPLKQNWSDPYFLRENLKEVLAPEYPADLSIDNQGIIDPLPYFLRIYVANDNERFLAIAQPAPGILQTLIPKAAIVVDGSHMTLKKIANLRELNRKLISLEEFDESLVNEINELLNDAYTFSLSELEVKKEEEKGFEPPKTLARQKAGSQFLIYNAPRYYPLTDNIIKQSIFSGKGKAKTLSDLASFPGIVLYTSEGAKKAFSLEQEISKMFPEETPALAYLKFTEDHKIKSSHLLSRKAKKSLAQTNNLPLSFDSGASLQNSLPPPYTIQYIDSQISQLSLDRRLALHESGKEILSLLDQNAYEYDPDFESKLTHEVKILLRHQKDFQEKIDHEASLLLSDFPEIPKETIESILKKYGLAQSQEPKDTKEHLKEIDQTLFQLLTFVSVQQEEALPNEEADKNINVSDFLETESPLSNQRFESQRARAD